METRHYKQLTDKITSLDGQLYKKYKLLEGMWSNQEWSLIIIKTQADTHAPPSHIAIRMSHLYSGFPLPLLNDKEKKCALADFLLRKFSKLTKKISRHSGSGKSGIFYDDELGPEIIERSAISISKDYLEIRFRYGLPGKGNRITAKPLLDALIHSFPKIAEYILKYNNINQDFLSEHITIHLDQNHIRDQLKEMKALAFIPDNAIIPRKDSASTEPLEDAVPFKTPQHLKSAITLFSGKTISGMLIPEGVTVITGGGFHGKSTILSGIKMGIYNHIKGDGREYLVSRTNTVKISAEDGRIAKGVDISPYISNLPFNKSSDCFSSLQCSGSTSQASSVIEALRINSECLLFDEDTCATNFLFCDDNMSRLIGEKDKTIKSYLSSARSLYQKTKTSTIIVSGSFSQSFSIADNIYKLSSFSLEDVTEKAKEIITHDKFEHKEFYTKAVKDQRKINGKNFKIKKRIKPFQVKVTSPKSIEVGKMKISFYNNDQLVSPAQAHTIAKLILIFEEKLGSGKKNMETLINEVFNDIPSLTELSEKAGLAKVRPYDLAFALNRFKLLSVEE